jgi:hypothetical protein
MSDLLVILTGTNISVSKTKARSVMNTPLPTTESFINKRRTILKRSILKREEMVLFSSSARAEL